MIRYDKFNGLDGQIDPRGYPWDRRGRSRGINSPACPRRDRGFCAKGNLWKKWKRDTGGFSERRNRCSGDREMQFLPSGLV